MRETININYNWLFHKNHQNEHLSDYNNIEGFEKVDIPHNAVDIPYNYFDENIYQIQATYKKVIYIDDKWEGKVLRLIFEGVSNIAHVFVGDEFVMTHKGGYTRFVADISKYVIYGQDNMITVIVDGHENIFVPPFGGVVDYLGYCGIYREVSLQILEQNFIENYFIKTYDPLNSSIATFDLLLSKNQGDIEINIFDEDNLLVTKRVTTNKSGIRVNVDVGEKTLWDINNPYLYRVNIKLIQEEQIVDEVETRFGFRQIKFKEDGFYLNEKHIKLFGLNRHQSYPYIGYAMPRNVQREDADLLKFNLGVNIVRCSHYPQSIHFLDRCDEIGLLVFSEIPGWQHIGNEEWIENSINNLKEMIFRDYNHPSIIIWGVRINESDDNHHFYKQTNDIAHQIDDTRPTGGVRNFANSEFLEDVYTFNDFIHRGNNKALSKKSKITKTKNPYLITEYNGHMFPTKRYDSEPHRLEHALRHLNVLNASFKKNNGISGAIGWCMNDYNTHQEFGSGDKVCYHGVLDMFRIPKLASYVYSSQQDNFAVLAISSNMNIGDYPGGELNKVYAFTNCDYIKLFKNNEYIATFYPAVSQYPHLKHPPIIIDDFIGELLEKYEGLSSKDSKVAKSILSAVTKYGPNLPLKYKLKVLYILKKYHLTFDEGVKMFYKYISGWGSKKVSYRFEGYIGNTLVKSITKENYLGHKYIIKIKRRELEISTTYDAQRVIIKKVNQVGDILPYCFDPITINVSGSIDLIGPNNINLQGGVIGFWIRTNGTKGMGKIEIKGEENLIETVMVK